MARITTVKLMQRCNTGNYEHVEFSAEMVIEEGESLAEATEKLRDYVDWNAKYQVREFKAHQMRKQAAISIPGHEDEAAKAEAWLKKMAERKAKVEAM